MPFVVLYDANVLYPSTFRDRLIRVAQAGLVQAKWTDQILDEVFSNLAGKRPDLDPTKLARTRELVNRAVRDCLVTGFEPQIDALTLPDPDDRHVLAAAIKARAQVIVTNNLNEGLPGVGVGGVDMEAQAPDDFVLEQMTSTAKRSTAQCNAWRTPARTRPPRSQASSRCSRETACRVRRSSPLLTSAALVRLVEVHSENGYASGKSG